MNEGRSHSCFPAIVSDVSSIGKTVPAFVFFYLSTSFVRTSAIAFVSDEDRIHSFIQVVEVTAGS